MSAKLLLFCIVGVAAMIVSCASGPHVDSGSVAVENKDMRAVLVFSAGDREKISDYFSRAGGDKTLPPGLAKKQKLPPGLQKHIEKYGKLPPGLEGKRLPPTLERTLRRLPEGYVRLKVGMDVVLLHEKTRVVFDVIWDVD